MLWPDSVFKTWRPFENWQTEVILIFIKFRSYCRVFSAADAGMLSVSLNSLELTHLFPSSRMKNVCKRNAWTSATLLPAMCTSCYTMYHSYLICDPLWSTTIEQNLHQCTDRFQNGLFEMDRWFGSSIHLHICMPWQASVLPMVCTAVWCCASVGVYSTCSVMRVHWRLLISWVIVLC